MPKLSIVVPCYNEAKNIPLILEKFAAAIQQQSVELILVNNGSTDGSADIFAAALKQPQYHFARLVTVEKNVGYGHGIMSGLRAATAEVLAWTHADLQTDPADVIKALAVWQAASQPEQTIVKGHRRQRSVSAWAFTLGMACIASIVLWTPLYDINAQPKLFHRRLLNDLRQPPDDFSLDLYILYVAKRRGYTLLTLPVYFGKRLYGESKWAFSLSSRYRTIMRTIKYIFGLRQRVKQFD